MATKLRNSTSSSSSVLHPIDEANRLEALRAYQILDTPPEKVFDDLVRLAAYICGTPNSAVTLIDAERQWFKAQLGLDNTESAREHAFCQYAMLAENVYEIEDATKDPLFQNNPFVATESGIRFYAGAPLVTPEGHALGTICTFDSTPRRLTDEQRDAMRILAREVVAHLELRRARLQLEQEQRKLNELLHMANTTTESLYLSSGQAEIFIKQDHKLLRVPTADIRYVEALGDYVNIYSEQERYTVYSTMKELEAKLPSRGFARIHRKYIVRLDRIVAIESDSVIVDVGRGSERVAGILPVPIGSSYKAALLSRLNLV